MWRPVLALAALLGACQTTRAMPRAVQNIDFVRGCWVQKDELGRILKTFLRVLPDRTDGVWLTGTMTQPDIGDGAFEFLRFARDGSKLMISLGPDDVRILNMARLTADLQLPPKGRRAVYGGLVVSDSGEPALVAVEGDRSHLHVFISDHRGGALLTLFEGERDGCD